MPALAVPAVAAANPEFAALGEKLAAAQAKSVASWVQCLNRINNGWAKPCPTIRIMQLTISRTPTMRLRFELADKILKAPFGGPSEVGIRLAALLVQRCESELDRDELWDLAILGGFKGPSWDEDLTPADQSA
jgi:hypothetical protein